MLEQLGINAKTASADLVGASTELKNKALGAIANALIQNAQKIIDANKIDYDSQIGILDGGMLLRRVTVIAAGAYKCSQQAGTTYC